MRIPFGIYAGSALEEIPCPYLQWLLDNIEVPVAMGLKILRVLNDKSFVEKSDKVMPFGKYAGFSLEEIPLNYIQWVIRNVSLNAVTLTHMVEILTDAHVDIPEPKPLEDSPISLANQVARGRFLQEKKQLATPTEAALCDSTQPIVPTAV